MDGRETAWGGTPAVPGMHIHMVAAISQTTASRNCQQKENCNATGSPGNATGLQELHLP